MREAIKTELISHPKLFDPCITARLEALSQVLEEIRKPTLTMAEKRGLVLEIARKCLDDSKEKVRKTAARNLREAMQYLDIESQNLVCSVFIEALESPDPEVRESAVLGLKKALARADQETRQAVAVRIRHRLYSSKYPHFARALDTTLDRLPRNVQSELVEKKRLPV